MAKSLFLATKPARDGPLGIGSFLLHIAIDLVDTAVDLFPVGIELVLCFVAELIKLFLALVRELGDALAFSAGSGDLESEGQYDMSDYLELWLVG